MDILRYMGYVKAISHFAHFLILSNENNEINVVYFATYLSRHTFLHVISVFACHVFKLHMENIYLFCVLKFITVAALVLEPPYIPWNMHMVCEKYFWCGHIVTILWMSATYVPYSSRLFHWHCFCCHWRQMTNKSR